MESENYSHYRGDRIKNWLAANKMRNQWMVAELEKRGLCVSEASFCHALSGFRKSPKSMMILSLSEKIIDEYSACWSGKSRKDEINGKSTSNL